MARNNFDGLRVLAALGVLFSHQMIFAGRRDLVFGHGAGGFGLAAFFTISGYLVSDSWARDPHLLRFAARRFLRIWPGLAALVAVTTAVLAWWPFADPLPYRLAAEIYPRWLAMQPVEFDAFSASPNRALNGSLWTIPVEVSCYALFAAVALLARRRRPLAVALAAALVAALAIAHSPAPPWLGVGSLFALGALLHAWPQLLRAAPALAVAGVAAIALERPYLGLIAIAPLFLWIGLRSWPGLRAAARWGDMSYGIYLWAWPVTQLGVMLLGRGQPLAVLFASTVACTGVLAWLSWHLVERPALRLKPKAPK